MREMEDFLMAVEVIKAPDRFHATEIVAAAETILKSIGVLNVDAKHEPPSTAKCIEWLTASCPERWKR